ncbi:rho-associated protein kinase 2-like [Pectinophora gossypiella]|uniref:rho-associated protein kinase 2-like n=1 Tax=Pectinophora gossypiella TaxID=13191 RepID=UPI00214EE0CA|nr:rho-associated protein kinase 2-like [Pectinophora gossypiella]
MDENSNLDVEFKRYLQILRPYLTQLADSEAIDLCNAWIQRLINCSEKEKPMRNRYIFVLCFQLARGVLEVPFLKCPPEGELPAICEVSDSESSIEDVEYATLNAEEAKVIYDNKKPLASDTENLSQDNEYDSGDRKYETLNLSPRDDKSFRQTRKQTLVCYTCPEVKSYENDQYECRANNLIMKLRELKKQNTLLHDQLEALKVEATSKPGEAGSDMPKVDNTTTPFSRHESTITLKSLKNRLHEAQEDRQHLFDTLSSLQEQLDNYHEVKKVEIEEIEAKHKLEIVKIKTAMREESKDIYDGKLEDLKQYYENLIEEIKESNEIELENLKKHHENVVLEKDKIIEEKDKTIQEKDKLIEDKNNVLQVKDSEIANLKTQMEGQGVNLQSMINKILEKSSSHEEPNSDFIKAKAYELEKRLNKVEKSKVKYAKAYENKMAYFQREKHLAECSLHLQLVRQRAQVINEIAEENQAEITEALEKLECKYKDIVANVQSTAIQRRLQDQAALDAILQSACGIRNDVSTNQSQISGKTVTVRHKEPSPSYDTEISGIMRNKVNTSKSYGEESASGGYCLEGERFGELFEKVYIPQRDTGDAPLKKTHNHL